MPTIVSKSCTLTVNMNYYYPVYEVFISCFSAVHCQNSVDYQNSTITITEGENVTLYCGYKTSGFSGLSWYRLNPGGGPDLIIKVASEQSKPEGRFTVLFPNKGSCLLQIQHSIVSDSALYLCSVEAQCMNRQEDLCKNFIYMQ